MKDNVVNFSGVTRLDVPVDRVIQTAAAADLSGVVIVGWDADGGLYFSSSYASGPEVLWLLQLASRELLAAGDE